MARRGRRDHCATGLDTGDFAALEFGSLVGRTAFAGLADPGLQTLAGCVVIFVGVLVVMSLVRMVVRSMVKALGLSVSDRILGMVFGLGRGVLVCMVLVGLGGMTAAPTQPWWRGQRCLPRWKQWCWRPNPGCRTIWQNEFDLPRQEKICAGFWA